MMKKSMKKLFALLLASALILGAFAGCAGKSAENSAAPSAGSNGEQSQAPANTKPIKIGVLVADVSGEEALGFRSYYENYIAKNYNVELLYTEQFTDAAGERSAIERFVA